MKVFGITLRRPSGNEFTAAAVLGCGLWLLVLGLLRSSGAALDRGDAGALLVVSLWGALSVRLGIRIDQGQRHLAASLTISAGLLALYEASLALVA